MTFRQLNDSATTMQIKDERPAPFTKWLRCDRCGRLSQLGEMEFHESISLDWKAGYGSVFGDGNDVQIDLCQHCLKITLGRWMRVINPDGRLLEGQLRPPDSKGRDAEFPAGEAVALHPAAERRFRERAEIEITSDRTEMTMLKGVHQPELNWPSFYKTLNVFAPLHLRPDNVLVEAVVAEAAAGGDAFWSDDLDSFIDDPGVLLDADVRAALSIWLENVRNYFADFPFEVADEDLAALNFANEKALIDRLVESLSVPLTAAQGF